MKSLIIHPKDPTTRFLCGIYDTIPNKTVITGDVTKAQKIKIPMNGLNDFIIKILFCYLNSIFSNQFILFSVTN